MRIKDLLEILNSYFSGSDGKGYDSLLDEYGLRPEDFTRLPMEKKKELIRQFCDGFKNCLANDLAAFNLTKEFHTDFEVDSELLEHLVEIGEAARALLFLIEHYSVNLKEETE